MGELFDRWVVVDWSASSRPRLGKDSIWFAVLDADGVEPALSNPSTRSEAAERLRGLLGDRSAGRTLIAIDAPLGYPAGSAEHFGVGGDDVPWPSLWRAIAERSADDAANHNNRFDVAGRLNLLGGADEGPFWGRPHERSIEGLHPTKPRPFTPSIEEFRHCERWLHGIGLRPASCWQLMGVGSVGSQTLTLLPILEALTVEFEIDVWPFTTGWDAPDVSAGGVVLAETWPTAFDVEDRIHWIRDAGQVHDVALELRRADRGGELAAWFAPPTAVAERARSEVEREEGWALIPRA